MTILHKILITTEPTPIVYDFTYTNNTRHLRSFSTPLLEEPPCKFTKFEKKKIPHQALTLWNKLPENLMNTDITFTLFSKIPNKCIIDNPIV